MPHKDYSKGACRKPTLLLEILVPIGVILGLYWGYIGIMGKEMEATIGFY